MLAWVYHSNGFARPMPDGREPATIRSLHAIDEIAPAAWDACAGDGNPFVSHAFLRALEDSKSVGPRTGWQPHHVVLEDAGGEVLAVAPLYAKTHSQGEYVFDHGWAQAYEQAGGRYYPKLQVAVPFTPVPGPRLLVRPNADGPQLRAALIGGLVEIARRAGVSSLHVTFASDEDTQALESAGLMLRLGCQYHWANQGYETFDDFLARSPRASASRCGGNGAMPRPVASPCTHWKAPTSRPRIGMPSSPSTWIPAGANGAGPI